MSTTNNTRITTAFIFALSSMATACAGFEQDDGFDNDIAVDEDRDDHEGEGAGQGGDGDGDEEPGNEGSIRAPEPGSVPWGPDAVRPADPDNPTPPPDSCEPYSSDLLAGQHIDTGSLTLSNTADSVELALVTSAPYQLVEAHAYLGSDSVPTTNDGAVAPGQFPYAVEFDEPTDSWQLSIPLAELEAGCGDELQVAVHAVVVAFEDGCEVFEETAWALGRDEFDVNWGWSFGYGICCAL